MTLVITHPYVSSVTETTPSGGPGGNVGPSEWNANHTLTGLVSPAQGGTGITSGTGVTFFSSATVIADSGTLTANALLLGGGANVAPSFVGSLGTTSTLLHGNASGAPSFGSVNLGSEVAGTLSTANLTNATTAAFGIVKPDNSTVTISSGVISASAGSVGGVSGNIQFDNSGSFGGFGNVSQGTLVSLGATSTATSTSVLGELYVYNYTDSLTTSASTYERAVFGWLDTSNVLTIGTQAAGAGSSRNLQFIVGGASKQDFNITAASRWAFLTDIEIKTGGVGNILINAIAGVGPTLGAINQVDGLLQLGSYTNYPGGHDGWLNYGGQARVTSNVTSSSTTMANVTGLIFRPKANRNYSFEAHLIFTDAAAAGIQCTVNATSTTTLYTMLFDGWVTDGSAVRGYTQGSAFGNVVASSLTTGTVGHVTITGTLQTSGTFPSTFVVQFAQNTNSATQTIIQAGSYMWVHDMP